MSQQGPNHRQVPDIDQLIQVMGCQNLVVPVIPVSYFKTYKSLIYQGTRDNLSVFKSSGSTSEHRSEVFYSEESLKQYQRKSTTDFEAVIKKKLHQTFSKINGYSFIPSTEVWKDSSLAQMIHWFSELSNIQYVDHQKFSIPSNPSSKTPIWIFATGEQILQFIENGSRIPKNAFLFETGGIKSRPFLNLHEYYEMLAKNFAPQKILSEYGSCELSRQAYKVFGEHYAFEEDVDVFIDDCSNELKKEGLGRLVVWDKKRTDYPYAIKTEDMVLLKNNQFQIKGRVNGTQPRGCSLKNKHTNIRKAYPKQKPTTKKINQQQIKERSLKILELLKNRLQNLTELFALETGSLNASVLFLESLLTYSIPKDQEYWIKACENATFTSQKNPTYQGAWALLAPSNHSIATMQHLFIAYCLDIHIHLKTPNDTSLPLLNFMVHALKEIGLKVSSIPKNYYIQNNIDIPIVFFGNTQNANQLTSKNSGVFWGHHQTAYEFSGDMSKINMLCEEVFHLGQAGCMNPRIIIAPHDMSFDQFTEKLHTAFKNFWGNPLNSKWLFAAHRYQEAHKPFIIKASKDLHLPWVHEISLKDANLLSNHGGDYFGVYLLRYKNRDGLLKAKKTLAPTITYALDQKNTQFPLWNGKHLGKPLFYPE